MRRPITRAEWTVLGFTAVYMAGFTAYFVTAGNGEFLWYIATMVLLVALVGVLAHKAEVPVSLLWALTGWGLAHMAGGGVPVGATVLYGVQLLPLGGEGELRILKYDQAVHAYGFGVTAWLLWHLVVHSHPGLRGSWTALIYPALGAMGLGAANEMVEFAAVLSFPETGVGGYYNTALDLVFNASGAVLAIVIIALADRKTAA